VEYYTLTEFQKNSGYYDIFIPNLKILSPLYYAYIRKLEAANEILVEKYPQTKKMYD
jgi:hypothetical protein